MIHSVVFGAILFLLVIIGSSQAQEFITPQVLFEGIQNQEFDAVIDVRTQAEWDDGHVENATFVENLASSGTADSILGCSNRTLAIYCRSGNRAGVAITRLIEEYDFTGTLYNAFGTSNWVEAGYELVTTESFLAPCQQPGCSCQECPENPPAVAPCQLPGCTCQGCPNEPPTMAPDVDAAQGSFTSLLWCVASVVLGSHLL